MADIPLMENPMTTSGDTIYGGASGVPTRLAKGTDGQVYTLASGVPSWADAAGSGDFAGKELDYVQITSNVGITSTNSASPDTVITGTSVAYDGSTIIEVEFWCPYAEVEDASGASLVFVLYDGGTVLGRFGLMSNVANAALRMPISLKRRLTPSAASHQYIVKAYSSATTANAAVGAGAGGNASTQFPAFIRITRVSS
jgi:hypothetical protein